MTIKNIKLKVETDEENQYVLNKLRDVNKGFAWSVPLFDGYDFYGTQGLGYGRAVCSEWKSFRYLVIDKDCNLILCAFEDYYNKRQEKEITFDEFKETDEE